MLCARKDSDTVITYSDVRADDAAGSARWEARYTFPDSSGRPVHNRITATFAFKDGKIVRHVDRFDLWSWTRMAMGPAGVLLGWTPFFQNAVRKKASRRLEGFMKRP